MIIVEYYRHHKTYRIYKDDIECALYEANLIVEYEIGYVSKLSDSRNVLYNHMTDGHFDSWLDRFDVEKYRIREIMLGEI